MSSKILFQSPILLVQSFGLVYYYSPLYIFKNSIKLFILSLLFLYSYINILIYSPNFLDIHYHFFNDYLYFGIPRCITDYSLGVIAYLTHKEILKFNLRKITVSFLQILLIIILISTYSPINYNRNFEYIAPFIFFTLIITLSIKDTIIHNLTNNNYGRILGGVSYPIYLIHPLYIGAFSLLNINLNIIISLIYLFLCITSSWVIHYYYEKPMMKLIIKQ